MLCLAPTAVWFGCYLRFSGRPELIPCFASAVLGRLRGRFSRVDAMLRFGAVFGSDYCCYFCCGMMLQFNGGRVWYRRKTRRLLLLLDDLIRLDDGSGVCIY